MELSERRVVVTGGQPMHWTQSLLRVVLMSLIVAPVHRENLLSLSDFPESIWARSFGLAVEVLDVVG